MSTYLDQLPATFRSDPFLGLFLQAFETMIAGAPDVEQPGLEEIIDGVADCWDPLRARADFLPWLAGWVALSLRADWDTDTQRGFIREVVPLYRLRGTLAGLQRMLEIYLRSLGDGVTRDDVMIYDGFDDPPHFFQVRLTLGNQDPRRLRATQETARAIIDREKPAHTFYALKIAIPGMRLVSEQLKKDEGGIPELRILGVNTWLGSVG